MPSRIRQFPFLSLLIGGLLVVGLALVSVPLVGRSTSNLLALQLLRDKAAQHSLWPAVTTNDGRAPSSSSLPGWMNTALPEWACPSAGEPCYADRILGLAAVAEGDSATAIARLTAAVAHNPQDELARLALAYVLHRVGRATEAAELWAPLATTYPRNVMGLQRLLQQDRALALLTAAQSETDSGQASAALRHYRAAVELFPGHLVAVARGLQLAQASGSATDAAYFRDQARLIEVPTDTRLCDQSLDAVSYLHSQGVWTVDFGERVSSVARWSACPLPEVVSLAEAEPMIALEADRELIGGVLAPIQLRNAGFEEIVPNLPVGGSSLARQPVCWQWYVRDEEQFKRSAWYGGLDYGESQSQALRISGLWIDGQTDGANPAAYYAPCNTRLVVEPGETVALAVTYRTATDTARAAIGLGDYLWLPPVRDWSRAVHRFTNQSAAPITLTPGLFLFNPDTVWFDDVALYRVE